MKLHLSRTQKSSVLGDVSFILDAKTELTDEEKAAVNKYQLTGQMVYQKVKHDGGYGLLGVASRFALRAMNMDLTAGDLMSGRRLKCKDIMEMLAVEEQLKVACENFKIMLECARNFEGEEIVDY